MPRLFIPSSSMVGGRVTIRGDAAHHLASSLRLTPGEELSVVDEAMREHGIRVTAATGTEVAGDVLWSRIAGGEPTLRITVIQALAKDGMDDTIDWLTATGASAIMPVVSERTVVRLNEERAQRRTQRWQSIAREAAQVAFRGRIPTIHSVQPLAAAVATVAADHRIVACAMDPTALPLTTLDLDPAQPLALVIGPEGGLSRADLTVLAQHNAELAHLGPRVFRARTAGAIALTVCMGLAGQLVDPVLDPPAS